MTVDWLLGRLGEIFAKVPEIATLKLKEELKCLAAHGVNVDKEQQGAFLDAEIAAYLLNPLRTAMPMRSWPGSMRALRFLPMQNYLVRIN